MREFASLIQQGEIFLVGLHGQDQALLWHVQKLFIKLAHQHIGALDQRGDFLDQGVVQKCFKLFSVPQVMGFNL